MNSSLVTLSAGKYWGMRRMADAQGRFKMTAVDQRPPIKNPIKAKRGTPEDEKWMAEMIKLAGSKEAAEKIIAEFDSLVAMSVTEVGHAHSDH